MRYLLFTLITSILLSCSGGDKTDQQDRELKVNDSWIPIVINQESLLADTDGLSLPTLEINVAEMLYSGSDGCNNFNGGIVELDKKIIRFGVAAGTRMMCMDMNIPDLFNRTLPEVMTWEIKKEKLHLFDADGNELMQLKRSD